MQEVDTLIARAKTRLGVTSDNALCRAINYSRTNFCSVKNHHRGMPIPLEIKLRKAAGDSAEEIIEKYL